MNIEKYTCSWVIQNPKVKITEELNKNYDFFIERFKNDLIFNQNSYNAVKKVVNVLIKSDHEIDGHIIKLMAAIIINNSCQANKFQFIKLLNISDEKLIDELVKDKEFDIQSLNYACQNSLPAVVKALIPKFHSKKDLTSGFVQYLFNPYANPKLIREFVKSGAEINQYVLKLSFSSPSNQTPFSRKVIKVLVELKADLSLIDFKSNSLLMHACSHPKMEPEFIQKMLDAGADVNQVNDLGETPLTLACRYNPMLVKVLIKNGAFVGVRTSDLSTPLSRVIEHEDINYKIVRLLIQKGGDCTFRDSENNSIAHYLVVNQKFSSLEVIEILKLIPNVKYLLMAQNKNGLSPLHLAALYKLECVPGLLALGADPELFDNDDNTYLDLAFIGLEFTAADISKLGIDLNEDGDEGTFLHRACNRYPSAIKIMLENGANVNALDFAGNSPLHVACMNSNISVENIIMLMKAGADPNLQNQEGETPFHIACGKPKIWKELLKWGADPLKFDRLNNPPTRSLSLQPSATREDFELLIDKGININFQNEKGQTCLHSAALMNAHLIKVLVDLGGDVGIADKNENSLLHFICRNSSASSSDVEYVLSFGFDINAKNALGDTPLALSCSENPKLIEFLISRGAEINVQNKKGDSPFHVVCRNQPVEYIDMLIKKGADVNLENREGVTPFLALSNPEGMEVLIQAGCSSTHLDRLGRNALHHACMHHPIMIEPLLPLGIALDNEGNSPLHLACKNNLIKFKYIRKLIDAGDSLVLPNSRQETPFLLLCLTNPRFVSLLIDAGFNINYTDKEGKTEFHRACIQFPKIIWTLIANGASVSVYDQMGNTPLHYAYSNSDLEFHFIQEIENAGGNASFENQNRLTPIEMALKTTGINRLQNLIDAGLDINKQNSKGQTTLHRVCYHHPELIPAMLALGANPNALDLEEMTPLSYCMNTKIGPTLIENLVTPFNINKKNIHGTTPLLMASKMNFGIFDYLVSKQADINAKDAVGNGCYHYAALNPQITLEDLNKLTELGMGVNSLNSENRTPLHQACRKNPAAIQLLLKLNANVNARDVHDRTPLFLLCSNPLAKPEEVSALISAFATVNAAAKDKKTPLHAAVQFAPHLIKCLMEHGAKVTPDDDGHTPLHYAVTKDITPDCLELLLKCGGDLNDSTPNGKTFLHLACLNNPNLIDSALQFGADPKSADRQGITPLMEACCNAETQPENLELFFEKQVEVNVKSFKEKTALHYACKYNPSLIPSLLKKGAHVNIVDQNGFTPFQVACRSPLTTSDQIQALLSAGAKINEPTKTGKTPLQLACRHSNFDVIRALIQKGVELEDQIDLKGRSLINLICLNSNLDENEILELITSGINIQGFDHPDFKKDVLARALVNSSLIQNVIQSIRDGIGISVICEALNTTDYFYSKDSYFSFVREELLGYIDNPIAFGLDRAQNLKEIKKVFTKHFSKLFNQDTFKFNHFLIPVFLQDAKLMQQFKNKLDRLSFDNFISWFQDQSYASEDLTNVLYLMNKSHLEKGGKADESIPPAPFFELNKFNEMLAQVNFDKPNEPGYRDPKKLKKDTDPTNVPELIKGMSDLIYRVKTKVREYQGVPKDQDQYEEYYANFQNLLMWFGPYLSTLTHGERADILIDIAIAGLFCGTRYFDLKKIYDIHFPSTARQAMFIPTLEREVCEFLITERLGILEKWCPSSSGASIHKMNQIGFLIGKELHLPNAKMYYADEFARFDLNTQDVLEKFYQEYTPARIIKSVTEFISIQLQNPRSTQDILNWFQANPPDDFKQKEYAELVKRIKELKQGGVSRSEIRRILEIDFYPDSSIEEVLREHQAKSYQNEYVRGSLLEHKKEYYDPIFQELEAMEAESFPVIKMYLEDSGINSGLFEKGEDQEYLKRMGISSPREFGKFIVEDHRRYDYEDALILEQNWKKAYYDEIQLTLQGKPREEARRYLKHQLGFQLPKDRSLENVLESARGVEYRESIITFNEETCKYAIEPKAIIHMLEKMEVLNSI